MKGKARLDIMNALRVSKQQTDFTALKTIFAQLKLCKTIQQNLVWVTAVQKSLPGLLAGGA